MNSRMISLTWMENWLLACEPNCSLNPELPLEDGRCRLSHQSPGMWEVLEQAEFEVLGVFSFEKLKIGGISKYLVPFARSQFRLMFTHAQSFL